MRVQADTTCRMHSQILVLRIESRALTEAILIPRMHTQATTAADTVLSGACVLDREPEDKLYLETQDAGAGRHEVAGVVVGVEADEVGLEHGPQQLLPHGQGAVHLAAGEGRVQEPAHLHQTHSFRNIYCVVGFEHCSVSC